MCSAEKRAEGLEYMHPKPSSHSGRIVGKPEAIQKRASGNSMAIPQKPTSGPRGRGPADFEFHSEFCTVRKIFYSTIFLNRLPGVLVARHDPFCCVLSMELLQFYYSVLDRQDALADAATISPAILNEC